MFKHCLALAVACLSADATFAQMTPIGRWQALSDGGTAAWEVDITDATGTLLGKMTKMLGVGVYSTEVRADISGI